MLFPSQEKADEKDITDHIQGIRYHLKGTEVGKDDEVVATLGSISA